VRGDISMEKADELADGLLSTSLWKELPPADRWAAAAAVRNGEYPFNAAEIPVLYDADGEELAEGDVEEFLTTLAPAMRTAGVELTVSTAEPVDDADDSYTVLINGARCSIAESRSDVSWLDATVKPLAQLNALLARAGSPLRWHTLQAGGNDGWALLIEPSVADLMTRSGLFDAKDIPSEALGDGTDEASAQRTTTSGEAASDARGRGGWLGRLRRGGRG
jgi:hypothetical protein